jgi:hypothetical protein
VEIVKKYTLSIILSFTLAMSLTLSGCGGSPNPPAAQSEDAEDTDQEAQQAAPEESEGSGNLSGFRIAQQEGEAAIPLDPLKENFKVKGIYVSAWNMKGTKYDKLIKLVQDTDLNAMVIDVKNDSGQVTYPSIIPLVKDIKADGKNIIPDLPDRIKYLKSNGIYTIGRVVVFKDPFLASHKPDFSMKKQGGGVWRDSKGVSWVDPYNEDVWNYNLAIAEEAAAMGFDEIQFDYVRFPDNGKKVDQQVKFQNPKGYNKMEAIQHFLARAKEQLPKAVVSADVFGLTTSSKDDMGIGQKWELIAPTVDVISPMIYPSHYSKGMYNIANPDTEPYNTVAKALQDALALNQDIVGNGISSKTAKVRPWYQDFTATWVKPHLTYGAKEVREQVRAGQELGIDEFLLWNPSGQYSYK